LDVKPASGSRLPATVGLIIAFAWPLLLVIPGVSTHSLTSVRDNVVDACLKWAVVGVLCVIVFSVQRWGAADLGLRGLGWRDILACLAGVVLAFILSGFATALVRMPPSVSNLRALAAVPFALRLGVVLTAAITEEFIYRGFGIEELASLTGSRWIGGVLSWLLFSISHAGLYGLSAALVVPALVGGVLTALYLWRRNLPSCMLMHAIMDGTMILLMPALMHAR
jgi:membrane protease YdiL (CAAX protease family)